MLAPGTSTTSLPPSAAPTQPSDASDQQDPSHLNAILGGTIGGATVILLILIFVLYQGRAAWQNAPLSEKEWHAAASQLVPEEMELPHPFLLTNSLPPREGVAQTKSGPHPDELDTHSDNSHSGYPSSSWPTSNLIQSSSRGRGHTVEGDNLDTSLTLGRKERVQLRVLNAPASSLGHSAPSVTADPPS